MNETRSFILVLVVTALAGMAAGVGYGMLTSPPHRSEVDGSPPASDSGGHQSGPGHAPASGEDHGRANAKPESRDQDSRKLISLAPMIVNIGGGGSKWIRVEGSIVGSDTLAADDVTVARISDDLMKYLRGIRIDILESAAGLEFLEEDLSEIIRIRSGNRAKRFLLKALVIE